MRLLLDTQIVIKTCRREFASSDPFAPSRLLEVGDDLALSVASLWEIAIKTRLGKLDAGMATNAIASFLETIGIAVLDIDRRHVVAPLAPDPPTRDPFDRLLLAQCAIEGMRLVTRDRALAAHPLAYRP